MSGGLSVSLNDEQVEQARAFAQRGDYPGMYRYLSEQVTNSGGDPRLSNWLSTAADINEGTGFYSGFVRASTISAAERSGGELDEEGFQRASDLLAQDVLDTLSFRHDLTLERVLKEDVGVAVKNLDLPMDSWAGALGAMAPIGIGGLALDTTSAGYYADLNAYYESHQVTPADRLERFVDAVGNSLDGLVGGLAEVFNENFAKPSDFDTLADPGFWSWAQESIFDGIKNASGAIRDEQFWEEYAEHLTGMLKDSAAYADDLWDFWFKPMFEQEGKFHDLFGNDFLANELELLLKLVPTDNSFRIVRYDPIALDLDGDGKVATTAEDGWSGAMFDNDGDGIRSATGWVGKPDGILVRDLNENGKIESGAELFGEQTKLRDGTLVHDGFAALSDLDSNGDGLLDSSDVAFMSIKVWRDANGNGVTDAGELLTLAALGITGISLASTHEHDGEVAGGSVAGSGTFIRTNPDGTTTQGALQDLNFDKSEIKTIYGDAVPLTDRRIANVRGSFR